MSKPKPDNRKDNVSKIKRNISATKSNMEAAEEMIEKTDNEKTKKDFQAKNKRRKDAIHGMEVEMKQEAEYNKKQDRM